MQRRGKLRRTVFIEGLKLHLKCGVYPEERKLGVEVELTVEITAETFVDYEELHSTLIQVSSGTFTYIEEFQDVLLNTILEKWNPESVRIKTVKLSMPFQNSFKGAGVELLWEREK